MFYFFPVLIFFSCLSSHFLVFFQVFYRSICLSLSIYHSNSLFSLSFLLYYVLFSSVSHALPFSGIHTFIAPTIYLFLVFITISHSFVRFLFFFSSCYDRSQKFSLLLFSPIPFMLFFLYRSLNFHSFLLYLSSFLSLHFGCHISLSLLSSFSGWYDHFLSPYLPQSSIPMSLLIFLSLSRSSHPTTHGHVHNPPPHTDPLPLFTPTPTHTLGGSHIKSDSHTRPPPRASIWLEYPAIIEVTHFGLHRERCRG